MKMKMGNFTDSQLLFHLILLVCKFLEGGTPVVGKFVLYSGLHVQLFTLYTSVISTVALLLVSYFIDRNKLPLNGGVLLRLFLAGCAFFVGQITIVYGLKLTSAEFVTVISCTIPIIASAIAIVCKVDNVHLQRYDGQAKVLGILIASTGAAIMSIYQGPKLMVSGRSSQWYIGALCATLGCFSAAAGINIQAPLLRKYHAPWTVIASTMGIGALFSALVCLISIEQWSLPSYDILGAVFYNALVGNSLVMGLEAWVLARTALLLVCCYSAVTPISTTILSMIFLGTSLYFGSLIGTVLVICGVILCGWSEAETKKLSVSSSNITEPLLA